MFYGESYILLQSLLIFLNIILFTKTIIVYFFHLANVITLGLNQCDHNKRFFTGYDIETRHNVWFSKQFPLEFSQFFHSLVFQV